MSMLHLCRYAYFCLSLALSASLVAASDQRVVEVDATGAALILDDTFNALQIPRSTSNSSSELPSLMEAPLSNAGDDDDDDDSLITYAGKVGAPYKENKFVPANERTYFMAEENYDNAGHPSYVVETSKGNILMTGDSFGDGEGRGWANALDASANLKWAWQSHSKEFDAVLGAATLPDDTAVLGGTRSVKGRWELLLVAIQPNGKEEWSTTLTPSSPQHSGCAERGVKNCYGVIYWMDTDPSKELLIFGGVVDFPHDEGDILWKSGGGQPDVGGVPFIAAIPFSKLATAPTNKDIQTVHYFNNEPGFTTVVSLRAERGKGVIALLPLNCCGGSVARVTYDQSGQFRQEWISALSLEDQVTDIAIVGNRYVVSATVNPGAKIEALTPDGKSAWTKSYDISKAFPPEKNRMWCQECWSVATHGWEVMLSCGVAELPPGDDNCDDGLWRSLLVTFDYGKPAVASYHLFGKPSQNFAVEYASYTANGEKLCAIDSDPASVIRFMHE